MNAGAQARSIVLANVIGVARRSRTIHTIIGQRDLQAIRAGGEHKRMSRGRPSHGAYLNQRRNFVDLVDVVASGNIFKGEAGILLASAVVRHDHAEFRGRDKGDVVGSGQLRSKICGRHRRPRQGENNSGDGFYLAVVLGVAAVNFYPCSRIEIGSRFHGDLVVVHRAADKCIERSAAGGLMKDIDDNVLAPTAFINGRYVKGIGPGGKRRGQRRDCAVSVDPVYISEYNCVLGFKECRKIGSQGDHSTVAVD